MKFDVPVPDDGEEKRRSLREEMGFGEDCLVFVAGSTHDGEERILLDVYAELKKEVPQLKMLLAPRHPERCAELEWMCTKEGVSAERRTQRRGKTGIDGVDVLLLDTMGELAGLYAVADIVFLGGTFVPIGGHNPLEPILYKKPVLFGPYTQKITDIADALVEVGGGIRVGDRARASRGGQESDRGSGAQGSRGAGRPRNPGSASGRYGEESCHLAALPLP